MRLPLASAAAVVGLLTACASQQVPLFANATSGGGTTGSTTTGGSTSSGTSGSAASSSSGSSSGPSSSSGGGSGSSSASSTTTGGTLCNLGDGGLFAPPLTFFTDAGPNFANAVNYPLALGDFDHDGNLDIALAHNSAPGEVGIFFGNGDGSFRPIVQNRNLFAIPANLLTIDMGDSQTDLVVVDFSGPDNSARLLVADLQANEMLNIAEALPLTINDDYTFGQASVAYRSDGRPELFVSALDSLATGCQSPVIDVFMLSDGGWVTTSVGPFNSNNNNFVGDFNEDGIPDILAVSNCGELIPLYLFLGNGDGTFGDGGVIANADGLWGTIFYFMIGDLNDDGHLDILVWETAYSRWSLLLGNGDGTFYSGPAVTLGNCAPYILGDLNGDGHLDFVGLAGGAIRIALGNGNGTFQPSFDLSMDAGVGDVAIGDVNNDGRPDLVASDSLSESVSVLLSNCR